MATPKQCWYCKFFEATDVGVSNQGICRRYAPAGIDTNLTTSGSSAIWPPVYEGTDERCGDYAPNPGDVSDPV